MGAKVKVQYIQSNPFPTKPSELLTLMTGGVASFLE